jgi:hypothetical protein
MADDAGDDEVVAVELEDVEQDGGDEGAEQRGQGAELEQLDDEGNAEDAGDGGDGKDDKKKDKEKKDKGGDKEEVDDRKVLAEELMHPDDRHRELEVRMLVVFSTSLYSVYRTL